MIFIIFNISFDILIYYFLNMETYKKEIGDILIRIAIIVGIIGVGYLLMSFI